MRHLIIAGPSGVGKSSFGAFAEAHGWLHLELDLFATHKQNGLDRYQFRPEWEEFWYQLQPAPLIRVLDDKTHAAQKKGAVVTMPSHYVPQPEHLQAMGPRLELVTLFGPTQDCLKAFLQRDVISQNLGQAHWEKYNAAIYAAIQNHLAPTCVNVFTPTGERRLAEEIINTLKL